MNAHSGTKTCSNVIYRLSGQDRLYRRARQLSLLRTRPAREPVRQRAHRVHGGQELSGGEQQMLSIGRALMTNPNLLILDEATEGLAPFVAREIWCILAAVRQSGIAVIVVDKNFAALVRSPIAT